MIRIDKSVRVIPFFIILIVCDEVAKAAPTLLAEFWHRNVMAVEAPSPPPATVPFSFQGGTQLSGSFLFWEDDYGPNDVGLTFTAPKDIVDDANLSIQLPNTTFAFSTGPANISDPLRLTNPSCGDSCVQVLVPDITRYTVTSLERIIDQLELIDQSPFGTYILKGAQRIRYFGEIPEPSAIALLFIALSTAFAICSRRMRNYG